MKDILKKLIYLSFFLTASRTLVYAQNYSIDYYGIVAQDIDENMSTMVSDVYYTQLKEIENFTIYDKRTGTIRTTPPDPDLIDTNNLIFFSEIKENKDEGNWQVRFTVIDNKREQTYSKDKTYDSFYKIMFEPKNELRKTIKDLLEQKSDFVTTEKNKDSKTSNTTLPQNNLTISSTEELSGTWLSENGKIVILRGGRGFVIFKNGAPMDITVTVENNGSNILIKQKGNSNASFYPELPRNIAIDAAVSAPPIEWNMKLTNEKTLEGTKTTLVKDGDSYKTGNIPAIWEKSN